MHYLSLHWESARRAAAYFFKQPLAALMILAMLAIAMTLPLTLYLGVQSSKNVLDRLSGVPQITLYMDMGAAGADTDAVQKLLAGDPRVKESRFVAKADAFVVTPADADPQAVLALQKDLAAYPMVESTQLDQEWMQTLYRLNTLANQIFWFLAVTLGFAFVLVAHNTIRLQILSRKEEIEITKLLGAPSSFVRRPFLYQAAWQGLLSALLSLGLCTWLMAQTRPLITQIFQPYGINLQWRTFYWWETVSVLIVVCLLGIAGAWAATRRHLIGFKARRH